jgi:hypothetical protein
MNRHATGPGWGVLLRQWSDDVVLLSHGPHRLTADQLARVRARSVPVIETPVVGLDSDNGRLRRIRLDDGQTLDADALRREGPPHAAPHAAPPAVPSRWA